MSALACVQCSARGRMEIMVTELGGHLWRWGYRQAGCDGHLRPGARADRRQCRLRDPLAGLRAGPVASRWIGHAMAPAGRCGKDRTEPLGGSWA